MIPRGIKIMHRTQFLRLTCAGLLLAFLPNARTAERPAPQPDGTVEEDDRPARAAVLSVPLDYPGRDANASWRQEAAARIEKFRKGDLSIVVNDASGQPVSGAEVTVKMKRHAFGWGAAARLPLLVEKSTVKLAPAMPAPDKAAVAKYQELLTSNFNRSGLINDLRDDWAAANQAEIMQAIDWLRGHNLSVRGYALVWPDWGHSKWAAKYKDRDTLNKEITARISAKVGGLKGKIDTWDVINEAKNNVTEPNSLYLTAGGVDAMLEWCKVARQADPNAKLYVTDDGVLDSNTTLTWQNRTGKPTYVWIGDTVYGYLQKLVAKEAPFDGVGFQGHFKQPAFFTPPDQVYARLERFAALGKNLAITEFEVAVPDPKDEKQAALQADYTRDLLTIFFSHPKMTEVTFWAIWEPEARKNPSALFRADGSAKPNGQATLGLLKKQWWTEANGKTDAEGKFNGRGFFGTYEITATQGAKKGTITAELAPGAKPMTIRLQ